MIYLGEIMGRRRTDQAAPPPTKRILVLVPVETLEALNGMASKKGLSRNAVIVQVLAKATKAKKRKGE